MTDLTPRPDPAAVRLPFATEPLPIGTVVLAWPGSHEGPPLHTRTRSAPWSLGGTLVVMVDGYAGGIALTHVLPLPARTIDAAARLAAVDPGNRAEVERLRDLMDQAYEEQNSDHGFIDIAIGRGARGNALSAALRAFAADTPDAGQREAQERAKSPVLALSALIDSTYPDDLDAEAHLWRRCAKVTEENGEVTEALLGLVGENPRKGKTHTRLLVRLELLDVALAALSAVAHLEPEADPLLALERHAASVLSRLRVAVSARADRSPEQP